MLKAFVFFVYGHCFLNKTKFILYFRYMKKRIIEELDLLDVKRR